MEVKVGGDVVGLCSYAGMVGNLVSIFLSE